MWHLNFRTGVAEEISDEEGRRRMIEAMKRQKIKDGVLYIDCDPPEDEDDA